MAIVQNPLTGRSSGKFAGAVFQTYFGKNVIRSKPLKVTNPKSDLQTSNRTGFAMVQKFISANLALFRNTCQALAVNQSVYIACVSYYLRNVLAGTFPNFYFDSNAMLFSYGTLPGISIDSYEYEGGNIINLSLSSNEATNPAYEHDLIHVVAYNSTTGTLQYFQTQAERKDLAIQLDNVEGASEDALMIYAFCFDPNSNKFSTTSLPVEVVLTDANPLALEITYNDPVIAASRTLMDWNNILDLPNNGTPFSSLDMVGNIAKLYGGANIIVNPDALSGISNVTSIIDNASSIIELQSSAISGSTNLTSIYFPLVTVIGDYCFDSCSNLISLILPSLTVCGTTANNNSVFNNISGNIISLKIPHAIESDGDIVALKAANTVTVIYSD